MSVSTARQIKLKRTTKARDNVDVKSTKLVFGEPFYLDASDGQYLVIGDESGESTIDSLDVFKALPKDKVDVQLFYKLTQTIDNKKYVWLQDEDGNWLVPEVIADQVFWDSDYTGATVKDKIDSLNTWTTTLKYAGASTQGGAATSATKLTNTSNIGDTNLPVYFNASGVPVAVAAKGSGTAINIDITGNAATCTQSTQATVTQKNSTKLYITGTTATNTTASSQPLYNNSNIYITTSNVLMGAAWNDFAELRKCSGIPGNCVSEVGDGSLVKTTERLQAGCSIISDTYGMLIGPQEEGYEPIAVAGRVLAYTDEDRSTFLPGSAVCSGENGTISMMTRDEIKEYPDRIVGYVSEIPNYETWTNNVVVDNRIWIKVK